MKTINNWLVGNSEGIMKRSAIWNLVSSVLYSVQSAVLLLVVTRTNGLYDAGVFTIAYTLTQMMATIGSYGMRSFQVSDVKGEYSFNTYFTSRVISVAAMILICISYALLQGYDTRKMVVTVCLCLYRVVDDFEDVFHGEMQKKMRLDIASKIQAIRIFVASFGFAIAYVTTRDLVAATAVLVIVAAIISVWFNMLVKSEFKEIGIKLELTGVKNLLIVCLPLCLSGYFYTYLVNAPKYAIDRNYSEEIQTIFSILFMPIFVINMLSSFIFKPMIAGMSIMWNDGQTKKFVKTMLRQMLIILGMTVIIMIGCYLIGTDILGLLYGVDLNSYRKLFTVMMLFGGFSAMVAFLVVILTIIRKQNFVILAYSIAVIIDLLLIDMVVIEYGIAGAGAMYGVAMGTIMVMLVLVVAMTLKKRKVK